MLRKKVQILIACLCFLLAFSITLQYKSVTRNNSMDSQELKRIQDLENELINANEEIINLKKENMQLTSDIDIYRKDAASKDSGSSALKAELEKSLLVSSLTAVEGPGIVLTLSDSTDAQSQNENTESYIVHDADLRSVVNELYGAGAEAVSINGERLYALSTIRCVGNTIMVNNKRCTSPFEIKAIGDSSALESGLNIRGGVLDVLRLYRIGVNVTKNENIKIDKFTGSIAFTYAKKSEKQVEK